MKKTFVILFSTIYLLFCIYNFFTPSREFLENENRYAETMPDFSIEALASGEYTSDIEKYITDKTVFRNFFVSLKANSEKMTGKKENNGVYFAKDNYLIQVYDNKDYSEILASNISAINKLSEFSDFNISFALIPTAYEILKDKLPSYAYTPYQKNIIDYTKANLKNVNFIDSRESLLSSKDDYLYFRTDHHQTMHGSFIVYKDIINSMGLVPYEKENFNIETVSDDFFGTTWSKATINVKGDSIIKYSPKFNASYKVTYDGQQASDSLYSEKNIAIKDKYTYYLDGNHGITTIKTSFDNEGELKGKTGEKLAIIKDSYSHSIIPFLANHYEEIVVFDLRYYNLNVPGYLKENGINNVLFIYNTDNFITDNNLNKITAYLQSMK